ncbi:MAG TPA: type I methionyl aminopeptidase, partial [Spirochaetia bacterium]|nr:type I methionyl aminopeptidase [Spirochaetia bacterium]
MTIRNNRLIKTPWDIKKIKETAIIISSCFSLLQKKIRAGISSREINVYIDNFIRRCGAFPSFPEIKNFPGAAAISINEELVHGVPTDRILQNGDLVSIDIGAKKNDYYADAAVTFPVGEVSAEKKNLLKAGAEALQAGLKEMRPGCQINRAG